MNDLLGGALLLQLLRISVPYLFAALGGLWSERSGVINIALEGLLLAGAFGAAAGSLATGSGLAGLALGVLLAVALAALYGLVVIRFRADQIVAGVAITLLALGATRYFLKLLFDSSSNSPRVAATAGAEHWLLPVALLLVIASHLLLHGTRLGLRLRAAGEHPEALRSVGVAVAPRRWFGVLASGLLTGLGGAWLAYNQHGFVAGMSAGRGFIALAAMILGRWSPFGSLAACLLFGAAETLQLQLQSAGLDLPSGLVQSIPYLATILALAIGPRGRAAAPQALGRPDDGDG